MKNFIKNLDYKTIIISVFLSILTLGLSDNGIRFGSNVTSTASSDTLETFRTNVNSSLTSLQAFASSTSLTGIIASSTPFGNVGIEQGTETNSLWIANTGSTTPSLVVLGVNGNGKVGIASSTPFAQLGIGTAGATSTISVGKFCMLGTDPAGRLLYITLATSGNAAFATSTTSCL